MLICLDQRNGNGCGATNRDSAKNCQQCGMSLRYALELHNPGTLIGAYRIVNVIGYGGFGAVYAAEDTRKAGQQVALKETFDPASIRAFQGEFALLHRLKHDHLPLYHEMFEAQGNGYLVMELIPGQSLLDVLVQRQGQPLAEAQVMGYAIQVCDVLTYLHRQTPDPLLHRDIKPANIRLTPDGLVKLVDFGLLKQGTDTTASSRMGLTPAYAPLEQWGGTGIHTSPQSDLYSLGATLYHLLTGKEPEIVRDRLAANADPLQPPRQHNPRIATHVSDAIMKALAIQPHNRFADAATFKQALLTGTPQPQPPAPPPPQPQPAPAGKGGGGAVRAAPINPLFPVTIPEWRDEMARCNEHFGQPAGYWCYVRPGRYHIGGWKDGDAVETLELPAFWIAKYPVTVQQYRQFVNAGGYSDEALWTPEGWKWRTGYDSGKGRHHPYYWPGKNDHQRINVQDSQPVTTITWYEAAAFARWLNHQLSLPPGTIYLPTEAEWEAAAAYDADGQRRTYPWGKQEPDPQRADFGRKRDDGPLPVGGHPAGAAACGAHNLAGSVWEWCSSDYKSYPVQSAVALDDFGAGVDTAPVRGGSWRANRTHVRCVSRPGDVYVLVYVPGIDYRGCRVARLFS